MSDSEELKKELIDQRKKELQQAQDPNPVLYHLQNNEALVVAVFVLSVTAALISNHLSETAYVGLMGTTVGYGIARIFNHVQGKE